MNLYDDEVLPEDTLGMKVTSGVVKIIKDDSNLIGISIGGGAPLCPCVYVVAAWIHTCVISHICSTDVPDPCAGV